MTHRYLLKGLCTEQECSRRACWVEALMGPQINITNPYTMQRRHLPVIDISCLAHTMWAKRVYAMGTKMTLLLKIYLNPARMCKEELYPGAVPGKCTNDSVWEDVHPWELYFLSSLMDPEDLFWEYSSYSRATSVQTSILSGNNGAVQLNHRGLGGSWRQGGKGHISTMSSGHICPSIGPPSAHLTWPVLRIKHWFEGWGQKCV